MQNIPFSSPQQRKQAMDFSLRGRVFGYFANIIIGAIIAVILHQRSIANGGVTPGYPWITFSIFIAIGVILGGAIAHTNFYFLKLSFFTNQLTEKDIRAWINFRNKHIQENIKQVDAEIADAEDDLLKLKDRRDTLTQKVNEGEKILESLSSRSPVLLQKV